ncbi:hypothetical protein PQX77_017990, partial [Marasmius sp. AFHP31]
MEISGNNYTGDLQLRLHWRSPASTVLEISNLDRTLEISGSDYTGDIQRPPYWRSPASPPLPNIV